MGETKTANRPAPWPQRFSVETLAPAVRRLLGTPRRGREGEQGAGQQRPARAGEVQQDSRKGPRRCGGRRAGAGRRRFGAWEEEARWAGRQLQLQLQQCNVILSVRSTGRGANHHLPKFIKNITHINDIMIHNLIKYLIQTRLYL